MLRNRAIETVFLPVRYVFYRVWEHRRRVRPPTAALVTSTLATAAFVGMSLYLPIEVVFWLKDEQGVFDCCDGPS